MLCNELGVYFVIDRLYFDSFQHRCYGGIRTQHRSSHFLTVTGNMAVHRNKQGSPLCSRKLYPLASLRIWNNTNSRSNWSEFCLPSHQRSRARRHKRAAKVLRLSLSSIFVQPEKLTILSIIWATWPYPYISTVLHRYIKHGIVSFRSQQTSRFTHAPLSTGLAGITGRDVYTQRYEI
jgi:hypothetical protein